VGTTRIGGKIALINKSTGRRKRKSAKLGQGPKVAFSGKINLFNFELMNSFLRKYGDIDDRPLSKISEQSTPIKRVSTPSTGGIRPHSPQESEPSLEWF
jgi:hypothetical protein